MEHYLITIDSEQRTPELLCGTKRRHAWIFIRAKLESESQL